MHHNADPARVDESPQDLAARLVDALAGRGWSVAVGEGDTGGLVMEWLTDRAGASAAVRGGVVAYHDDLKRTLLGVPADLLAAHGAVSRAVAEAMAEGARRVAGAEVGLATTGIAGPHGATATKPVGLAWVAVCHPGGVVARQYQWHGDRQANRRSGATAVLRLALECVV